MNFQRIYDMIIIGGGPGGYTAALYAARAGLDTVVLEKLLKAENVEFRWNSVVAELLYEDRLTGIRPEDVTSGEASIVDCDGVFISVGRKPATELVRRQLELGEGGYVVAGETTQANIPGVYAVGDVRTKPLRQVVTAVADGAVAVHMAEEFLTGGA